MRFKAAAAVMLAVIGASATAVAAETTYPTFCQGIAIQGSQNRMFVSAPFAYPLKAPPETGPLRDPALGSAFAAEVKAGSGQTLLDYSCYARPDEAALTAFLQSTLESNKASWTIERLEWRPSGAKSVGGETALAAPTPSPSTPPPAKAASAPPPPVTAAADRAAEQKARQAAELAAQAARAAEDARVKAARAAESDTALRALNTAQGQASSAALQKQEADQRAFQEQQRAYLASQRAYQEQQRAFNAAKAEHEAALKSAEEARKRWQADVAACASGDRARCAQEAASR